MSLSPATILRATVRVSLCLALLALSACAPGIEERIAQKQEVFSAYPATVQERLRRGQIRLGDDADAVWIVYGAPSERLQRVATNGRTEVWIYKILGYNERLYPAMRPVYHDVRGSIRKSYYLDDTPEYEWKEVLRIEFKDGHVSAVQQAS